MKWSISKTEKLILQWKC